jgi:hypothetical protein
MVTRTLWFDDGEALARVAAAIDSMPANAVAQLRVTRTLAPILTAAVLRAMAGGRNVSLAFRAAAPSS